MNQPWSEQVLDTIENFCSRIVLVTPTRLVLETQPSPACLLAMVTLSRAHLDVAMTRNQLPEGRHLLTITKMVH